jgi:feruloyl-CoA synthase
MVIHFETDLVGLGLPVPGATVKLVPTGDRYEVRVAGPMVTPAYLGHHGSSASIFDDEGFYKLGDLAQFHDPMKPSLGMKFVGRLADEFKLSSGAWVYGGQVRTEILKALAPLALDVVVCGDNRDFVAVLAWPAADAVRRTFGAPPDAPIGDIVGSAAFRDDVARRLAAHTRDNRTQTTRVTRCLFLTTMPTANSHEMSDKGTVNRRLILEHRAAEVERLYAIDPDPHVVVG